MTKWRNLSLVYKSNTWLVLALCMKSVKVCVKSHLSGGGYERDHPSGRLEI